MGSGRDKRKKVKDKQKQKEDAEARRERDKLRAAGGGGGGLGGSTGLISPEDEKAAKKSKKLSEEKELAAMILEIRKRDAGRQCASIELCAPPSPRLNASLTHVHGNEVLMFGGEHYDGNPVNTHVFNELYRWNVENNEWSVILSLNPPPPRCSHQAILFRDSIYVFGGEFCTSDKFHHHRDLWRLDLKTNAWEEIKARGGPSARSGHRMVIWRNNIVLFGGFYEAFRETQWFNDLYIFSIQSCTWRKIEFPPMAPLPGARSGHQLVVHQDMLYLNGGYTKFKRVKMKTEAKVHRDMWSLDLAPLLNVDGKSVWERVARKGQSPSERSGAVMILYKNRGITFGGVYDGNTLTEKQAGYDGVKKDKRVPALFFNELHTFDIEKKRWFELPVLGKKTSMTLKRRKKNAASGDTADEEDDGDDFVDYDVEQLRVSNSNFEEPWLNDEAVFGHSNKYFGKESTTAMDFNIAEGFEWMLEADGGAAKWWSGGGNERAWYAGDPWVLNDNANMEAVSSNGSETQGSKSSQSLSNAQASDSKPQSTAGSTEPSKPAPLGRLNPSLLLLGHTLVVYGGTFESENREWALDDAWSIDLRNREEWKCILNGTPHVFDSTDGDDSEESNSDDDDDGDSSDEETGKKRETSKKAAAASDSDEEPAESSSSVAQNSDEVVSTVSMKVSVLSVRDEIAEMQNSLEIGNASITPASGESLRDFFARTGPHWNAVAYAANTLPPELFDEKALRRDAFALAEKRYELLRPVLSRLDAFEKEQLESEGALMDTSGRRDNMAAKDNSKGTAKTLQKKKKKAVAPRLPEGSRPITK